MPKRFRLELEHEALACLLNYAVLAAAADVPIAATDTPIRRHDECSVQNWLEMCG